MRLVKRAPPRVAIATLWVQGPTCESLQSFFPLTKGGVDYLGMQLVVSPGCVVVHQHDYAVKVVKRFGYHKSGPVSAPLKNDWTAADTAAPPGGVGKASKLDFARVLGCIGYLATCTMPWLLYAFGVLSAVAMPSAAFPEHPHAGARAALARVLRWVATYPHIGLTYVVEGVGEVVVGAAALHFSPRVH